MARRILAALLILIAVVAVAFLAGPFFRWQPTLSSDVVERVSAATDLDAYLKESEAKFGDRIKPGLEKGIVWYQPPQEEGDKAKGEVAHGKTPVSVVYLHGFSASRGETAPLPQTIAEKLGANLFYTRLAAHGLKDGEDFATVRPQDWIDDAREALAIGRRLGDRVIVVGMSTGALLGLQLALENLDKTDLAALVLISPNFHPAASSARWVTGPLGPLWAKIFIGKDREFPTESEAHAYNWTARYRSEGVVALMDLVHYAAAMDLRQVKLPVLALYTKKDTVVSVPLIEKRFEELGSPMKKLVDLPQATRHEFAGQVLAPEVVAPAADEIVAFIRQAIPGLPDPEALAAEREEKAASTAASAAALLHEATKGGPDAEAALDFDPSSEDAD